MNRNIAYDGADSQMDAVVRRQAPWGDYKGDDLFEGDIIEHPDGTRGKIEFHCRFEHLSDKWKVDYGDRNLSLLCLQVGDKGQAVKVVENLADANVEPDEEIKELLVRASREMAHLIDYANNEKKKGILSTDLDEPDYFDYQTCHELLMASKKI